MLEKEAEGEEDEIKWPTHTYTHTHAHMQGVGNHTARCRVLREPHAEQLAQFIAKEKVGEKVGAWGDTREGFVISTDIEV